MNHLLFLVLGRLLKGSLFPVSLASFTGARKRFPILIFHRVLAKPDPFAMAPISEAAFDELLVALTRTFRILPLGELIERSEKGDLPARSLALTFDDGYRDNATTALPLLRKHRAHATIFLATGLIGTGECAWYDRVLESFRGSPCEGWDGTDLGVGQVKLISQAVRANTAFRALEGLKRLPAAERDARISRLEDELDSHPPRPQLMLNWDEARVLRDSGWVELGAHTHSHPILSRCDDATVAEEIKLSRDILERELGVVPRLFAYPNGRRDDFDERAKRALRDLGFRAAMTTESGVNARNTDRFELLRLQAWDPNPWAMAARLLVEVARG